MPNTLAHIGLQVPLSRLGIKDAPLQWIVTGCIIPDIPWIVQRIFTAIPDMDLSTLRLYFTIQASFAFCLLLSLALAMLAGKSKAIFLLLAGNSLTHLLLDAAQIKWGNGVNLFIPFSYTFTSFDLFWPEHFSSYILSGLGLLILLIFWQKAVRSGFPIQRPSRTKAITACLCLLAYCISPLAFIDTAFENDMHFSKTLSDPGKRAGKEIILDREQYDADSKSIEVLTGEHLQLTMLPPNHTTKLSIQGHFLDAQTIRVEALHIHPPFRDMASIIGLLLIALLWIHSFIYQKNFLKQDRKPQ